MFKGKKSKKVQITTLLGRGTELKGNLNVEGSARIDGRVDGDVTVSGHLIIGTGAVVMGDVKAQSVLIGGEVRGNILSPEKAEIASTAKVLGNIVTGEIVIDEHATFQGKCDMNQTVPYEKEQENIEKSIRVGKKSAKAAIAEALKEMKQEEARLEEEAKAAGEQNAES